MRKTTFIYALKDPTTNEIRYIGKANDPNERYKNHINKYGDKNTHKRNWLNKLREEKLKPILEILEEVSIDNWVEFEKSYIKKYLDAGCKLLNYTDGGDGATFANSGSFKKGEGGKKVVMLDKDGNYIKTFNMIKDAEDELGTTSSVSAILTKNQKTSKGFTFLYENDYKKMTDDDIIKHIELSKPTILTTNKTSYKEVEIYQYDLNMNFIKKWKSLAEASKTLNINKSTICMCAKLKGKTAGGYIWKYKK
jgi:predicted GIY-YIG superfamily endonuclease